MAIQTFKAKVAEHSYLAKKYQNVHLELVDPSRIEFLAGQYIMLKVPGLEGVRQYSIASSPSMKHAIELVVDVIPKGVGSTYLASLSPGDEVEFMAPAGRFLLNGDKDKEKMLWFVATGSGIAPLMSMIIHLLVDKKDAREMWLHWGLRHAEDIFWFDEFARLSEQYDNFNFDLTLSRPPKNWKLGRGYVGESLLKQHKEFVNVGAYLCGSKRMIESVKVKLLDKGLEKGNMHHEQFYD